VTIEEVHTDNLEIVEHPVELGTNIADHSFLRPAEVVITCGYSNSPGSSNLFGSLASAVTGTIGGLSSIFSGSAPSQVKDIYEKFLKLQRKREPFDILTGKRAYQNMLIQSISTTTEKDSENVLMMRIAFKQVLIVSTRTLTVAAPAGAQASPQTTAPTTNEGTKQLAPAPAFSAGQGQEAINPTLRH
jgi:hypothetical protein